MTFLIKTSKEELVIKTGKYNFIDHPADEADLAFSLDHKYDDGMDRIFGRTGYGDSIVDSINIIFKKGIFIVKLTECAKVMSVVNEELDAVEYNIVFISCMYEPTITAEYVFTNDKIEISKALLRDRCVISS